MIKKSFVWMPRFTAVRSDFAQRIYGAPLNGRSIIGSCLPFTTLCALLAAAAVASCSTHASVPCVVELGTAESAVVGICGNPLERHEARGASGLSQLELIYDGGVVVGLIGNAVSYRLD